MGLLGLFLLSGCGFQPLHGVNDGKDADLTQVKIAIIKDRAGQYLRNRLLDQFNPYGEPKNPSYGLYVNLSETQAQSGIRKNETAKRTQITLTAQVTLKDEMTKEVIHTFTLDATSAFSVGTLSRTAAFPATMAEEKAVERAADMLARDIYNLTRASLHEGMQRPKAPAGREK